jgi:hypothetical protein
LPNYATCRGARKSPDIRCILSYVTHTNWTAPGSLLAGCSNNRDEWLSCGLIRRIP